MTPLDSTTIAENQRNIVDRKIKHSSILSRSIVLLLWNFCSLRHLLVLHSLHQNKRSKPWFVSRITLLLLFKITLKAAVTYRSSLHSALSSSLPPSPFLVNPPHSVITITRIYPFSAFWKPTTLYHQSTDWDN